MNIDKSIVERTLNIISEYYGDPVDKTTEVTAAMLYKKDPTKVTQRTHLARLKRLVEQGVMTCRVAKEGELAFKPVEDDG